MCQNNLLNWLDVLAAHEYCIHRIRDGASQDVNCHSMYVGIEVRWWEIADHESLSFVAIMSILANCTFMQLTAFTLAH